MSLEAGLQSEEERHLAYKSGKSRGFGKRERLVDQEDFDDEEDDDYVVLNVERSNNEAKLYYMEGFIDGNRFKTMIDTVSPVTFFALHVIKRIMKMEKLPVREMIEAERYVKFKGKSLQLLGYVFCELQVNDSYIRILIARSGSKSTIERADNLALQTGTRKG